MTAPHELNERLAGSRSAPRMPIGRPLTPPASILAPALRGVDHDPANQQWFVSRARDVARGDVLARFGSVGVDHRLHLRWRRAHACSS